MTDFSLAGVVGPNWSYWPTVNITNPTTGPLGGLSVTIQSSASDSRYGTPAKVHYYWRYFADNIKPPGPWNYIGAGTNATYDCSWTFPSCGSYPLDRFRIYAYVEGVNGRIIWQAAAGVDVRLTGRGC